MAPGKKIAVIVLSAILPGIGHLLLGKTILGVTLAGTYGSLLLTVATDSVVADAEWEFASVLFLIWGVTLGDVLQHILPAAAPLAVHYRDSSAAAKITAYLAGRTLPHDRVRIYCPGCGAVPGDSFGPLVGDHLASHGHSFVCGTSASPLNAITLPEKINAISPGDYVIVVDAVIGSKAEQEGIILIRPGPVRPGAALGKKLPPVGQLAILFVASIFRPGLPLAGFDAAAAGARSREAAAIVAAALHDRLQQTKKTGPVSTRPAASS